jgi:drug/metabolite transporter (DMT)-like permease
MLIFGTVSSLVMKIAYETPGQGLADGNIPAQHTFVKPWFLVLVMFVSMTGCIPLAGCKLPKRKEGLLLGLTACFDLSSTALMFIGLIWVNPDIWQMMRGAEMIFAAFFGITFLKRKLNKLHLAAILLSVIGIIAVGSASALSGEGHGKGTFTQQCVGMSLIVAGQAMSAAQLTFEDYFMSALEMDDAFVVGWEGLWGTVLTTIILCVANYLPGNDVGGRMENTWDSFQLIASSPSLCVVLLIQMLSLFFYNYCGMSVTGNFSGVFRTVLETLRTLFVWLADLGLFYSHAKDWGQPWTKYSLIEAGGFAILVLATFLYRRGDEIDNELKTKAQDNEQV